MRKDRPMPVRFYRYGYEYVRLPLSKLAGAKTDMIIDPNIQFGEPTIKGTRMPLESLGLYGKHDGIELTAKNFGVSTDAVQEAMDYLDAMPLQNKSDEDNTRR